MARLKGWLGVQCKSFKIGSRLDIIKITICKNVLGAIDHPAAKAAHHVRGAVGYGRSGGGTSGGSKSLENRLM